MPPPPTPLPDPAGFSLNNPVARLSNSFNGALHGNVGALWIVAGIPVNTTDGSYGDGFDGDFAFNPATGQMWQKRVGVWVLVFTFTGS